MGTTISKRTVDALKPGDRNAFLWDANLKGFGVKITPAGKRIYFAQYRIGKQKTRYTIGQHGHLTPEQARKEATRVLGEVAAGKDPNADKNRERQAPTIANLCDLYMQEGSAHKKESTRYVDRGRIERHIKPLLGRKLVHRLTRGDVERFMLAVADGQTATDVKTGFRGRARVSGGKGTANRAVGLLGAILSFAVTRTMRMDNPAHGVKKFKEGRRDRFLSQEEMARMGTALSEAEKNGVNPIAISVIRMLIFTGCRKSEMLTLEWAHVDFEHSCLRLPDSKTGFKVVPLGAPGLSLLTSLPRSDGNPYVFPGEKPGGHIVGVPRIWGKIRATVGLEDVSLHTMRHSFASLGVGTGLSLPIVGAILGHSSEAMTARYGHLSANPVKDAAERISGTIAAAMKGDLGNNVLPLKVKP
ncbi:MAG: integrase arm-type DNA-binding domain-containing protein [Magnetococcales bacterium]|nr:integrase arm-type DNA-binding domain-containing protein [Magnetococcales bacterium]